MKKFIIVLLLFALIVGLIPAALAEGDLTKGDLDGDNVVTVRDLILLVKYVLGTEVTLAEGSNPDINESGTADVGDCVALLQILCGAESADPSESGRRDNETELDIR